jgi:hypothetical protein
MSICTDRYRLLVSSGLLIISGAIIFLDRTGKAGQPVAGWFSFQE